MERKTFLDKVLACGKKEGFAECEVFYRGGKAFEILIMEGEVANYENSKEEGLAFRGNIDGRTGYAYTEQLTEEAIPFLVNMAKENAALSGLENAPIRYIVDDCKKFIEREIRRGNKYDAIIMDPPSYGRGPNGEMWKIENDLYKFVELCTSVLSDEPLFVLINSYTTGLQPMVLKNILQLTMQNFKGKVEAYEVGVKTEEGISLPCGAGGMFINE